MMEIGILLLSVIFQLLSAFLALRLAHLTRHRTGWILVSVGMVLMVIRLTYTLVVTDTTADLLFPNAYDTVGLGVSALMLAGLLYIRRYLYSAFVAERCLRESERRYRALAQNIPNAAIFLFDQDGRCLLADGAVLERMGLSRELFEDKYIKQFSLPDGWNEFIDRSHELALKGDSITIERPYKDRMFSIQFTPVIDEEMAVTNSMAMVLDITDQMLAEKERVAAYEFLQHTIDGVAEPVMVIGLDYQVKLMNRAIRDTYDNGPPVALKACYALSHHRDSPCNDPAHPCPLQQVRTTLMPVTLLHEHQTNTGEIRQIEILASPLLNENGGLQGIIETSRDITERKRVDDVMKARLRLLEFSNSHSADELLTATLDEIEILTGSSIGFYHLLESDQKTVSLQCWSTNTLRRNMCRAEGKGSHYDIDQAGVWVDCVSERHPVIHNDYASLLHRKGMPEGHVSVVREVVVPIFRGGLIKAIIGVGNKTADYYESDIEVVSQLGDLSWDIMERRKAEEALQESEARYRAVIYSATDAFISVDSSGTIIDWNPGAERMFGYKKVEILGQPLVTLMPVQFHRRHLVAMKDVHNNGAKRFVGKTIEVEGVRKDKSEFTAELSLSEWQLAGDQFYSAIVRDVTERKQMEDEKNRLINAIENSIDGIAITNEYNQYIYVNEAHANIYGHPRGELLGATWQLITPKNLTERIGKNITTALQNPQIGFIVKEVPALRKDGSQIPTEIRARALWDKSGHYAGHICNVVDIRERKRAEEVAFRHTEELEALAQVSAAMRAAQSQNEIFSTVLTQIGELFGADGAALAVLDSDNQAVSVKSGYGAWENWTGRRCSIASGTVGQVFATGLPYISQDLRSDALFEWPDDAEKIPCGICAHLVTNQRIIGVLWIGRQTGFDDQDLSLLMAITDMVASALQRQALHEDLQAKLKALQEAQSQIIQSEKLAAIGQLTSGIAHELNNPLTSVLLYSQMMQNRPIDDGTRRDLGKVVGETLRASKIVRNLLDFARQRPPETAPVNVNDILKSVIDLVSYELLAHDVQGRLDLSPDIPIMEADPYQLQQVFVNLVNNAWQAISASQKEGTLWIKTELAPSGNEIIHGKNPAVIRIAFEDDGPGIPEENLSKVFDPFFTTKPEGIGTGLGLSICHGIITKHGGSIRVESEMGKGSTFVVELPIVSPGQGEAAQGRDDLHDSKQAGKSRILIIDDEQNVCEVLTRALKGRGYQIESVNNARHGLEKIAQVDYSTILCDVRMPEMSGMDFYREVYSRSPELVKRIVFITGIVEHDETQMLIAEKKILCLNKPFELDELYRVIKLNESRSGNEGL